MQNVVTSDPVLDRILEKAVAGERLNLEEGILLFSCDLLDLGEAATQVRDRLYPDRKITFIVDRNISYTNACFIDCDFCAFYRRPGDPEAYTLSIEQIFQKIQELVDLGGTQVLIQGGVNPKLGLDFYLDMFRKVRERFPQVQAGIGARRGQGTKGHRHPSVQRHGEGHAAGD